MESHSCHHLWVSLPGQLHASASSCIFMHLRWVPSSVDKLLSLSPCVTVLQLSLLPRKMQGSSEGSACVVPHVWDCTANHESQSGNLEFLQTFHIPTLVKQLLYNLKVPALVRRGSRSKQSKDKNEASMSNCKILQRLGIHVLVIRGLFS